MTYEDIYKSIVTVAAVLNNIEVRGRQNLDNLGGSIRILEEAANALKERLDAETAQ